MMSRLRSARRDDQAGFTLVELLVAMTIMAGGFIVILGAISVFLSSTRTHRASADLDAAMRTYVEKLADASYDRTCPTDYNSVAVPSGFTATIGMKYWDGNPAPAGYGITCASPDTGAQQLTVTLTRTSDGHKDTLVIVKRDEVQP
jgi:prepilin-type N-terminal cleavage/methylation domain-containing protein